MMADLIGAAALAAATMPAAPVPAHAETVMIETPVGVALDDVWDAVRDVYAVDIRLVPGMVTKVEREGDVRTVTFANGFVVTERILEIDDRAHRLTYAAFGGRATFHRAIMEVVADGATGSRIVWRTEFLPAELRFFIEQNMQKGSEVMKQHLENAGAQGVR